MPERVHYSKAPIAEAITDLGIVPAQGFSIEDLAPMRERISGRYPDQEEEHIQYQQMSFLGNDLLQTEGGHQVNGFRFTSADRGETFHARLDGFAFSIRAPYDNWEAFRDEARSLWNECCALARPEGVTRTAMRYINRIDIPNATMGVRLEDYLRTYPEISVDFPENGLMSNFLCKHRYGNRI